MWQNTRLYFFDWGCWYREKGVQIHQVPPKYGGFLERRKCEVYSRTVGYLRPTSQWNPGKREEFKNRKMFEV